MDPQSSGISKNSKKTSLHQLEEIERKNKARNKVSVKHIQIFSNRNNKNDRSQQASQQFTADNTHTLKKSESSSFFEGYSSVTSINSRYIDSNQENEKWKDLIVFMCTESSIMLYSNVFLMVS